MKKVEAEGKELVLRSDRGHIAIIPKDKVKQVQAMLDAEDFDGVSNYVSSLPLNSDYAKDGVIIPPQTQAADATSTAGVTKQININQEKIEFDDQKANDFFAAKESGDDIAFTEKYGESPHKYQMQTDPKYAAKVAENAKSAKATIDYPSTNRASKSYTGNPNLAFMNPNGLEGEALKDMEDFHLNVIGAALPVPGLEAMGAVPGLIGKSSKFVPRSVGMNKVTPIGLTDEVIEAARPLSLREQEIAHLAPDGSRLPPAPFTIGRGEFSSPLRDFNDIYQLPLSERDRFMEVLRENPNYLRESNINFRESDIDRFVSGDYNMEIDAIDYPDIIKKTPGSTKVGDKIKQVFNDINQHAGEVLFPSRTIKDDKFVADINQALSEGMGIKKSGVGIKVELDPGATMGKNLKVLIDRTGKGQWKETGYIYLSPQGLHKKSLTSGLMDLFSFESDVKGFVKTIDYPLERVGMSSKIENLHVKDLKGVGGELGAAIKKGANNQNIDLLSSHSHSKDGLHRYFTDYLNNRVSVVDFGENKKWLKSVNKVKEELGGRAVKKDEAIEMLNKNPDLAPVNIQFRYSLPFIFTGSAGIGGLDDDTEVQDNMD